MEISMTCHASEEIKNLMDDIIAKAQAGDKEAFGLIFEHHHRFIYKFIYAMLGDHRLAEELTQETFLGAYQGIGALRGESALKTWLCGIAKNIVYKSFRASRKKGASGRAEFDAFHLCDEKNPPPDEQFLSKELNQVIMRSLGKLNADRRLVFILKEMQQLSYKEISLITGNTIPMLKTSLFRAKIEMRTMLRPYLEAENEL
jgi:RNA polymerase sigma-70 factor (ECF subfamily)